MNNTFNIKRFGLLVKRQWLDFGKIYLIGLVVLTAVLSGFYIFNLPKVYNGIPAINIDGYVNLDFRYPVFVIVGFLFLTIEAGSYFNNLGQKPKAIIELMVPSSTFEKFLCGIFYTSIIGLLSYLLIFYLVDLSFCSYLERSFATLKFDYSTVVDGRQIHYNTIKVHHITAEMDIKEYWGLSALPFLISSVFLLGSVYFERFQYIKTAVSIVALISAVCYIGYKAIRLLTDGMISNGNQHMEKEDGMALIFAIAVVLTLVFWLITFVRLKEKEV